MGVFVTAPWISVALPVLLAVIVVFLGRVSKVLVPWIASLGPLAVLATGVGSLLAIPKPGARWFDAGFSARVEPWTSTLASQGQFVWFKVGALALTVGWSVDTLAAVMLVVVGVVALMVMIFSVGYMHGDSGWARYYALLCLFTGSMTLLVIGNSFTTLFIGWELVGACSYVLIGFWYQKPSASRAAVKAFLTTRVGDIGLLVGLGVLWAALGTLGYVPVVAGIGRMSPAVVTTVAICIAIGAIGKSAQFPLHIWLPDAMEGPTPVSALIHAATMVAAGVYLIARTWPLFEAAPAAQTLLLTVGTISALGAGLAAIAQHDIKKVLAYSTISQLGFMFAALGVGAWTVAFFHLVTHAAFKAMLFLASGSVIHGAETQDMREMGGLRKAMPVTFVIWLIGVGALVGIPPLSGFFSKDLVLDSVWAKQPLVAMLLFATVFVTGLYSARATRLTFFGERRVEGHAHESGASMLVPLAILAVPAALLGFAGPWLFERLGELPEKLSVPISGIAVAIALAGVAAGWLMVAGESADEALESRFGLAWHASQSAFGWNAVVDTLVVRPTVAACRILWSIVDRFLIDGTVEGSAIFASWLGKIGSSWETGDVQNYGALIALGVAVLLAVTLWMGR